LAVMNEVTREPFESKMQICVRRRGPPSLAAQLTLPPENLTHFDARSRPIIARSNHKRGNNMAEKMTEKEKRESEVKKALGEPFAADFTDYTRKLRMNLIVASFIGLAVVYGHVSILPSSSFFGLTFKGINDRLILTMLLLINIYTTVHFLWNAMDHLLEWRIRLSGARSTIQTMGTFSDDYSDYPRESRQSTLYNWWLQAARDLPHVKEKMDKLHIHFEKIEGEISAAVKAAPAPLGTDVTGHINGLRLDLNELTRALQRTADVLDSPRITVSLSRFDSAFRQMLTSQNLRWLILELGLPAVMGISAILMLMHRMSQGMGFGWLNA